MDNKRIIMHTVTGALYPELFSEEVLQFCKTIVNKVATIKTVKTQCAFPFIFRSF